MSQPDAKATPITGASAEAAAFRDVIRHLASGVTIITSSSKSGEPVGMTATAVCSVSATPPMLLVSLTTGSHTAQGVIETGAFAVHLLPHSGRKHAEQLADVLGWFLCQVEQSLPVADHVIFVGRVLQCELKSKSPDPLLYFDRSYRKLAPGAEPGAENLEPWGSQDAGLPGFGW
jgi:flavin reductase (DIM6/NTAB) family NADH-FMN oxidoreductase RutF